MADEAGGATPRSGRDGAGEPEAEATRPLGGGCHADPEARVDIRQLPRLAREGVRMVWAAGRRDFLVLLALQLVSGLDITLLLVLGRRGLDTLLVSVQGGLSLAAVAPWAVVVASFVALHLFVSAVQRERQQLLGELVVRYLQDRVVDVTTAVELDAFDVPAFHNRSQRIQRESQRPLDVVWGLSGLAQGVIGVVGVVVAFLTVAPLLVPLVVLVVVLVWLGASRRSQLFFRFARRMTPRDRERVYLFSLLTGREEAKEVRAFGTAPYLRNRYRRLYDERLHELRGVALRSTFYALVAGVGIGAVMGAMLMLVVWLTLRGDVHLADAGIAVAGVGVVGGRLANMGFAAGSLSEAALYLDDYRAFVALAPTETPSAAAAPAPERFRRLEVEGLTFIYPTGERPALVEVSLEINAGEVVALVGENGSGKTTLAKLPARLYTPQSGSIRWDGVDISTVDSDDVRRHVAVIFQDFLRYHLPARENIGLGRWELIDDPSAVERAARQAGAHDFLARSSRRV